MMSQRSVAAAFVRKTYELVEDERCDDVVSWNQSGSTFVVWKIDEFCKDLLPTYFKHNNFSSFVRQLNTYGFRKIVPDKWEFSNENFKRGHKDLLTEIRRRKSIISATSPSIQNARKLCDNSGDYLGSGSTSTSSSWDSRNPGTLETSKLEVILKENQELKRENEKLNSNLSRTRKQLEGLIGFLSQHVKLGPKQLHSIGSTPRHESEDKGMVELEHKQINENTENKECVKLFGVWMKEKRKKRGRDEIIDICGAP